MRLVLLFCYLSIANGRTWSGSADGSTNFIQVGRFAFGPNGGTFSLSSSQPTLVLSLYNDNPPTSCGSIPDATIPFSTPSSSSPITSTMLYLSLNSPRCADTNLHPGSFSVTATQANGSKLSYEEQGLPAIYGTFFVFTLIPLALHMWAHFFRPLPSNYPSIRPKIVQVLILLLSFHLLSDFFHMIEWVIVDSTGKDSGAFLGAIGGLLRLAALGTLWVFAAFIATGYGITTNKIPSIRESKNYRGAILLASLIVFGLTATLVYAFAPRNPGDSARGSSSQIALAFLLMAFILGYLAWFVWSARITIAEEPLLPKKQLLTWLLWTTVASILTLPFAELLC